MSSTRVEQSRLQTARDKATGRAPKATARAKRVDWGAFSEKVRPPSPPRNINTANPFDDDYVGDENMMTMEEADQRKMRLTEKTTDTLERIKKVTYETEALGVETLATLHDQGEQIRRTHLKAVDVEQELSKSEQLLNRLGGLFERKWKNKKTKKIDGPKDYEPQVLQPHNAQEATRLRRELLRQKSARMKPGDGESFSDSEAPSAGVEKTTRQRYDEHRAQQDEALDEISKGLERIKGIGNAMNQELEKQDPALTDLQEDIDELNSRVKGAHERGFRLLQRKSWW